ncbi:MAG: hypothetical protein QM790_15410 [Nibricoccus sp.]
MKTLRYKLTAGLLFSALASTLAFGRASATDGYHFEVGLGYTSGTDNIVRQMETNFGFKRDHKFPVGLQLNAYRRFSGNYAVGAGIGPGMFFKVTDTFTGDQRDYVIPASVDFRYFFRQFGPVGPYARVGLAYAFAGGDHLATAKPGPLFAVGASIGEKHGLSLGFELGCDTSTIKVKNGLFHREENVRPVEFCCRAYLAF